MRQCREGQPRGLWLKNDLKIEAAKQIARTALTGT